MPRVSVLINVYNCERYLEEAVGSMLAQTERDFELVLVDDGSQDGTPALVAKIAARDARIRALFLEKNLGIPGALNRGLAQCRGDWIARLDADDVALPNRLERQLAFADAHPDAVMIGSDINFIDGRSRIIGRNVLLPTTHEEIDRALCQSLWPLVQSSLLIRRATLEALGGYREDLRINSDHELFLRLAEAGRLYSIPERLTRYRLHPAQITGRASDTPVHVIVRDALARRGQAAPPPPRLPYLFGKGIYYATDVLVYRDGRAPLRNLLQHPLQPGAWARCFVAYARYVGWAWVHGLGRLFGGDAIRKRGRS